MPRNPFARVEARIDSTRQREREFVKAFFRDELGSAAAFLRQVANEREGKTPAPSLTPEVLREQAQRLEALLENVFVVWADRVPAALIGQLPPGGEPPPAA